MAQRLAALPYPSNDEATIDAHDRHLVDQVFILVVEIGRAFVRHKNLRLAIKRAPAGRCRCPPDSVDRISRHTINLKTPLSGHACACRGRVPTATPGSIDV